MTLPTVPDWTRRTEPVEASELRIFHAVGNPGATGTVYEVAGLPPCLYKKYVHPSIHATRLDRLITWRNSLSAEAREFLDSRCAWPLVKVTENGQTAGFLMRSAPDAFWADMAGERHTLELQHLIHTAGAKAFGIELPDQKQRLALVERLAEVLAFLDAHQFVYGDVNERNVLWSLEHFPRVYLIDCDNARPAGFPAASAGVAMPRNANWRDPDLPAGGYPDTSSDRYTLAVFCYRVFYEGYLRPGTAKASFEDDRRTVLIPQDAPHFPELERVFRYGLGRPHTRPSGAQWVSVIRGIDLSAPQPVPLAAHAGTKGGLSTHRSRRPRRGVRGSRIPWPVAAAGAVGTAAAVLAALILSSPGHANPITAATSSTSPHATASPSHTPARAPKETAGKSAPPATRAAATPSAQRSVVTRQSDASTAHASIPAPTVSCGYDQQTGQNDLCSTCSYDQADGQMDDCTSPTPTQSCAYDSQTGQYDICGGFLPIASPTPSPTCSYDPQGGQGNLCGGFQPVAVPTASP